MNKLQKFGKTLKQYRVEEGLSLREVCKKVSYDASNWSKIERGRISPPADLQILKKWALALGISKDKSKLERFIDEANIAQGIIPSDILSNSEAVKYIPAFFRTIRNQKPKKEDIDKLLEMINNA